MNQSPPRRRVPRSILALFVGMLTNVIPGIATDAALVALGLFPPLNEPAAFSTPLLILATAYRSLYGIAGGYFTARLAPSRPIAHSFVLGLVGFVACTA